MKSTASTATSTTVSPTESALMAFASVAALLDRKADKATRLWLYRGARSGTFPAPLRLSKAKIGWRRADVLRWLETRQAVNYGAESLA